ACSFETWRTTAGMVVLPARFEASQRRSPAINWNLPLGPGRSTTGCTTPLARIESANSFNESSLMRRRGWEGLGSISSIATSCVPEGDGAETVAVAADDRPGRSESRPRPRALRLSFKLIMFSNFVLALVQLPN